MRTVLVVFAAFIATVSAEVNTIELARQFGNPNHNFGGRASISQNSQVEDKSYAANANYYYNGNGISYDFLSKGLPRWPGGPSETIRSETIRGTANIFDNGNHRVNVNAFGSRTRNRRQSNGLETYGAGIDFSNDKGHSASLNYNKIPQFGVENIDVNANVNLFRKGQTSLDLYGGASRGIGRSNNGQKDFNTGFKFLHRF